MKISPESCQIINDSLALYYVDSDKFGNPTRKREIIKAMEEFKELTEEKTK